MQELLLMKRGKEINDVEIHRHELIFGLRKTYSRTSHGFFALEWKRAIMRPDIEKSEKKKRVTMTKMVHPPSKDVKRQEALRQAFKAHVLIL